MDGLKLEIPQVIHNIISKRRRPLVFYSEKWIATRYARAVLGKCGRRPFPAQPLRVMLVIDGLIPVTVQDRL